MNKVTIMKYYDKNGKESCSNWLFNTGFLICKEGRDDVNNFTKTFALILNWVFSPVLHSEDFLVNYFLDRTIFINQHTKLVFWSNSTKSISDKFTLLESFEESTARYDLYDFLKETRSF